MEMIGIPEYKQHICTLLISYYKAVVAVRLNRTFKECSFTTKDSHDHMFPVRALSGKIFMISILVLTILGLRIILDV